MFRNMYAAYIMGGFSTVVALLVGIGWGVSVVVLSSITISVMSKKTP